LKKILVLFFLLFTARFGLAEERILDRLDHFLAVSEKSDELFAIFSNTFQLPIAWPHESYNGFASGGVSVGGSVLELISYPEFNGDAHFSAIAYVPIDHSPAVREQIERNGAALGNNEPYTETEEGETYILWETFNLAGLSTPALRVFVCDYKYRDYVAENRENARRELEARQGGPLGVVGLAEILVGTPNVSVRREEWSKLNLQGDSDARLAAGDGAYIKLVEHSDDTILGITLKVRSIEKAAAWLSMQGILGSESGRTIQIAPEAVQGLSVSLVQ
jgi:hypothetical protein